MIETQFAVITFINNLPSVARFELMNVAVDEIESVKECVERRAKIDTPTAPITDLEYPPCFFLNDGPI
jgi:hypothetical protein